MTASLLPRIEGGAGADREEALRKGLKRLILAYVNLLEIGRDRIVSLGGTCDPVDVMERGDPSLNEAKALLRALQEQSK